jgi:hypothetical protein
VLVTAERAMRQRDAEAPGAGAGSAGQSVGQAGTVGGQHGQATGAQLPSSPAKPKRFHGTVTIDPTRAGRDAGKIADEVLAHLVALIGAEATVTMEIDAQVSSGVPENVWL